MNINVNKYLTKKKILKKSDYKSNIIKAKNNESKQDSIRKLYLFLWLTFTRTIIYLVIVGSIVEREQSFPIKITRTKYSIYKYSVIKYFTNFTSQPSNNQILFFI